MRRWTHKNLVEFLFEQICHGLRKYLLNFEILKGQLTMKRILYIFAFILGNE